MDISEEGYKKNEFSSGWKRVNRDTSKDTIGINLKSLDENIEKFKDEISELFKEKDLKEELLKEKISLLENNISSIANEVSLLHREIAEQNEIIKKAISILYKLQENKEVAEDTANRGGFKNNLFRKR